MCPAQGHFASCKRLLLTVVSDSIALRLVATTGRSSSLHAMTQFTVSNLCCQVSPLSQAPGLVSFTWLPYILISELYSIGNTYPCEFIVCVLVCWVYISLAYWVCLVKLYVDLYIPVPFNKGDEAFFSLSLYLVPFLVYWYVSFLFSDSSVFLQSQECDVFWPKHRIFFSPIPWFHEEPWW